MNEEILVAAALLTVSAAEAKRRTESWFRRGYVWFSDVQTRSTHLRRADLDRPADRDRRSAG